MALRLAAVYALIGGLWILFSDRFLGALGLPIEAERLIASVKGVGYVVVTSLVLYGLALNALNRLRRAQEAVQEQNAGIRRAYVDVLDAATGGRLVLVVSEELASLMGSPLTQPRSLTSAEELSEAREAIRVAATGMVSGASLDDLTVAVGETLANALKHAGSAVYQVFVRQGVLQVSVADEGPGIDFKTLPKAALVPGFSTDETLGMGFTIMLTIAERVLLCTDETGTEVVLEFA